MYKSTSQQHNVGPNSDFTQYGVCVFRNTGLDDKSHVEFSRRFGELDDIRPYLHPGRKLRYDYVELFDAGNVGDDGELLTADHPRWYYNKVRNTFQDTSVMNNN